MKTNNLHTHTYTHTYRPDTATSWISEMLIWEKIDTKSYLANACIYLKLSSSQNYMMVPKIRNLWPLKVEISWKGTQRNVPVRLKFSLSLHSCDLCISQNSSNFAIKICIFYSLFVKSCFKNNHKIILDFCYWGYFSQWEELIIVIFLVISIFFCIV